MIERADCELATPAAMELLERKNPGDEVIDRGAERREREAQRLQLDLKVVLNRSFWKSSERREDKRRAKAVEAEERRFARKNF